MYGPANRLLRSTVIVLVLTCAATGCQSVTQQKMAWSFPPLRDDAEVEEQPIVTVQNQSLPPLPTDYDRWMQAQARPAQPLTNQPVAGVTKPPGTEKSPAPLDNALVRTSAVAHPPGFSEPVKFPPAQPIASATATAGIPLEPHRPVDLNSKTPESMPLGGRSELFASKASNSIGSLPAPSSPPVPVSPPPVTAAVALDPKTTQQIVKKIVGATDDILSTGLEEELIEEDSLPPAKPNSYGIRDLRPKAKARKDASVQLASQVSGGPKSATERPPLETLASESDDSPKPLPIASLTPPLVIPKAAICRAVDGRGRFRALPAHLRAPGSPVIIYWELDGLARDTASRAAEFTAVIELLSSDREEILASVRETVRETGAAPVEGDYAALRWTIPAEIAAGEYRIRISVTEAASKRSATTEIDLALGRGPVASRFVLP